MLDWMGSLEQSHQLASSLKQVEISIYYRSTTAAHLSTVRLAKSIDSL
jgi:hypothetical protein